jgi:hypothetical protein
MNHTQNLFESLKKIHLLPEEKAEGRKNLIAYIAAHPGKRSFLIEAVAKIHNTVKFFLRHMRHLIALTLVLSLMTAGMVTIEQDEAPLGVDSSY